MKMQKRTTEDEKGKLIFQTGAVASWQDLLNRMKHSFLNKSTWEPQDFEDETNEGVLHVVQSFLTYEGLKPKRIKSQKADLECMIKGVKLSVIAIADEQRETVFRYDKEKLFQPDGNICFVADSAESWLLFYEQIFGNDANNRKNLN